jgi:hypothetical protein
MDAQKAGMIFANIIPPYDVFVKKIIAFLQPNFSLARQVGL